MCACENNLFIQFDTPEKKDYFLSILENVENQLLFQSFIPIFESKKETYGTDSDVYIEYITFDVSDSDVINIIFYTNETPCIEFCKRVSAKYSVNIQLLYFCEENGYSGQIQIFHNQVVKNELYNYWQGMYVLQYDLFWERLQDFFESMDAKNFMEFLQKNEMTIYQNDFSKLNYHFDEFKLLNQFKNL
uniref:YubB ferredoxin-like domain-containing protein n=1 Tax=viral metagenome TaxID=1070528 RepID=A0A6C0B0H1_9ZZZZ